MHPDLILKYQKASADSLVFKMSLIEQNPRIIWRAIEDYYGVNFFKKIIEIDYGVNDEEVKKRLKDKIKKFQNQARKELDRLGTDFAKENQRMKDDYSWLQSEMELLQLGVEKEIALQRERVEEDFAFKYKLIY